MPWTTTNTAKGDNKLYSDAKGVVPSLDLRFASQKNLNDYMTATPLVDHQRSMSGSNLSAGTFVNSSGLIETAKVNFLTYSEDISTVNGWTVSATAGSKGAAPNGLNTATLFTGPGSIFKSGSGGANTYTSSVFLKSGTATNLNFRAPNNDAANTIVINCSSGAIVSDPGNYNPAVTAVGNGWYRVAITSTTSTAPFFYVNNGSATSFYLWGAQLEEGSTATTYIPTTNLPSAAPRFDHDPTTGESLGLLIEESRVNYCSYSQIDPTNWTQNNAASLSQSAIAAPDGGICYDLTTDSGGPNSVRLVSSSSPVGTAALSVFARFPDTGFILNLRISPGSGGANCYADFNPATETFQENACTGSFQKFSDGWYKLTIVSSASSSSGSHEVRFGGATSSVFPSFTGKTCQIWGAQLETGSFPTSYIPTTGTALTRSADVASITGSNFSSWYNQSGGTLFIQASDVKEAKYCGALTSGVSGAPDTLAIYRRDNNTWRIYNTGQVTFSDTGATAKVAMGYSVDGITRTASAAWKGSLVSNVPTDLSHIDFTILQIGTGPKGAGYSNGCTSRLTYFPERLPDSTLQAITAS